MSGILSFFLTAQETSFTGSRSAGLIARSNSLNPGHVFSLGIWWYGFFVETFWRFCPCLNHELMGCEGLCGKGWNRLNRM